jgi:hypothetical protein
MTRHANNLHITLYPAGDQGTPHFSYGLNKITLSGVHSKPLAVTNRSVQYTLCCSCTVNRWQ